MEELLSLVRKNNIYLKLVEGKLAIKYPKGEIDKDLLNEIRDKKDELISYLSSRNKALADIPTLEPREHYALSSAQRRLWILSQFKESNLAYIIPGVFVFEGALDYNAINMAVNTIIERHESLRTVFRADEQGGVHQYILEPGAFQHRMQYINMRQEQGQEQKLHAWIQADFKKPFDLVQGPLLRTALYQMQDNKWIFTYVMHHIISDGWSVGILMKELMLLYNAYTQQRQTALPELRIQYKDYAAWQLSQLESETAKRHKQYWLSQFEGELPVLELALDKPRPAVKTYNGGFVNKKLDRQLTRELRSLVKQQGATLFMGLLATVNALFHRYTGQEDIILGSPIAGRDHADLEGQIGNYVNTLALRCQFRGSDSFSNLLEHTRAVTLAAYDHQSYPFDELVNELNLQRNPSRSPLFDVVVVLQNAQNDHADATNGSAMRGDMPNGRGAGSNASGPDVTQGNMSNGHAPGSSVFPAAALNVSRYEEAERLTSKFDLLFNFFEAGDEIQLRLDYNTDIFHNRTAIRLANHFEQLLQAVLTAPGSSINKLDYLSNDEKNELLLTFNDTAADYPDTKTIADLFRAQAISTPTNIAVVCQDRAITYRSLNEHANQLAAYLREKYAIKADDLVAVKLDRSEWMIVALLGILKAGGAYVPIDPAYPADRISYMVQDSGCKAVIDDEELQQFKMQAAKYSKENPPSYSKPGNLAYVIYTSGTTGNPKGTLVEHRNVIRLLKTSKPLFDFSMRDVWTMFHSYCFDFSVWEMYGALLFGGRLVIVPSDIAKDPEAYLQLLRQEKVTVLNQTPSYFYNLINAELKEPVTTSDKAESDITVYANDQKGYTDERAGYTDDRAGYNGSHAAYPDGQTVNTDERAGHSNNPAGLTHTSPALNLRYIIFGGEALSPGKLREWKERYPATKLINMYGITETTVHVTYKEIEQQEIERNISNIGKPIPTLRTYVLDQQQQLMPIGAWGELYVGGAGVARSYLNRPELTAQRFVPSPFSPGERLYRSGDRVRLLGNGEMEYEGRIDEQVKIRGYRIELAEIEHALLQYQSVKEAVVLTTTDAAGEKSLIAYLITSEPLTVTALRSWLTGRLPEYMVPAYYVELEQFPLTSNGKINKKALRALQSDGMATGTEYVAPRNEQERQLSKIWQHVLGKENVGIRDGFFELGGDSIKVLRMVSEIRKALQLEITIADVYQHNTIEKILAYALHSKAELEAQTQAQLEMEAAVRTGLEQLKERILLSGQLHDKENIEDIYPMSAIEKGMVFAALFSKTQGVYHDQFVYRKTFANFDAERFTKALELLAAKHSILRTGFLLNQEADVQVVYKKVPVNIEQHNLQHLASIEQQRSIRDYLVAQLAHPFEVSKAPLWRMTMFSLGQNEYAFAWQFHHAILDGWSNASFITELNNLYLQLADDAAFKPAPLKAGYKDFIIQQEIDRKDEAVKKFWERELSEFTRLDLFTEEETLVEYSAAYDSNYVKKLRKAAVELNTTVKGLSFSAFLYLMKVLNYDKEILVGLVTNTRPQTEDGDKILGCFLNTIPVRMAIDEKQQCRDFVNKVSNKLVELKKYEKLSTPDIATVTGQRSKTGNPFFDVYFDYVDFHIYKTAKNDGEENATSLFSKERTNTYFDFDITSNDDAYVVRLRLARKLKSGLTLQRIAALYNRILEAFINTPTKLLSKTEYLGDEEKQKILYELSGPKAEVPSDSITSIIQNNALAQPNAVAVKYNDNSITYRQLNENSNRMARFMMQQVPLKSGEIVAIITERNDAFISNVLAVWKAGAAYLPIDPEDPIERINTIIADAKPALVITDNTIIRDEVTAKTIFIPAIQNELQSHDASNLEQSFSNDDLAYVIYTSGSTGVPKGAMVEHIGMLNHLYAKVNDLKIDKQSVIAQNASQCFDISVWQSFAALVTGGTTVVYDKNTILNPDRFISMVEQDQVSLLELVPSYLFMLMELIESAQVRKPAFSKLQFMILTGEALKHPLLEKWFRHYASVPVMNAYGPTEASDDITHCILHSLPENVNVPVGKPVQNFNIYIVNNELQLCPLGVKGEIVVSGIGVGRGYLNNLAKTQAVFVEDPFFKGRKMYKTGDLGRMRDDGNIEFFGRKDYQLKIKGFRIELEEIEVNLNLCPEIKEGVIIDKKDEQGEPYLVAYYTADQEAEIKTFLRQRLPHYMIPSYFVKLDKLPLTPNGKIDRKALKEYDTTAGGTQEHIEPTTELEKELVELWKEMFNKEKISTTDNFFELGGDSFKAIRLVSKSNKFSVPDLYAHPTIAELARFMLTNTNDNNSLLSLMLDAKEHAELSFIGIPNSAGDPFSFNETVTYLQQYTDNLNFYGTKLPRTAPAENEDMGTMLEVLGQAIVAEVREKIKTPLVIFGQCNGSVLALKVAELLQKENFDVRAVCVGGILPPKRTNYRADSRSNDDILEFIKSLDASIPNDPGDLEFFLKHFRYDSDLAKAGFNYFTEAISGKAFDKFRMPFYFITGNRDPLTKGYKLKYKRWRNYADNVKLVVIDKVGHYILRDAAGDLAKIMKQVAETVSAH